jgi:hypothetical protein
MLRAVGKVMIGSMAIELKELHGFARVFVENMDQVDRDTIEILLRNIPNTKNAYARRAWERSLITVFAEASREVISDLVEEYREIDNGAEH